MSKLTYDDVNRLTGGRVGIFDVVCPFCSSFRKPQHRSQRKMRIWRQTPEFCSFFCIHCEVSGYVAADVRAQHATTAKQRAAAIVDNIDYKKRQRDKANWLWEQSH